jgi:leucyl-tRNA synthetase
MKKYNPQKIEAKWQKFWEKNNVFETKDNSKKSNFFDK